jgi:N-acetylglucosamine-6-sulfatase
MKSLFFAACAFALRALALPPNFLVVLSDDLEFDFKQDRLDPAIMPNLARLREAGAHLINHVAAQPVCGPSRSSLLAGRYPHNVGYRINGGAQSIAAWTAAENNTLGTWLTARGYHTSYLGKYVNSLEEHVPAGWTQWHGFSSGVGTYNYYNATMFDVPGPHPQPPFKQLIFTGTHQADFLGPYALRSVQAAVAAGKPFYIQVNPVMVHWGTCYGPEKQYNATDPHWEWSLPCPESEPNCCPVNRAPGKDYACALPIDPCPSLATAHRFDSLSNPHVPSWNASAAGGLPDFMSHMAPITNFEEERQNAGFRNRTASAADLDRLLGVLVDGLEAAGVAEDTYIVFTSVSVCVRGVSATSPTHAKPPPIPPHPPHTHGNAPPPLHLLFRSLQDNGYHLGEHRMVFGKGQPYDTDVRLPFYVRGPGVLRNATLLHPTNHVDLTATIVELAGATPIGPPLDGLSFAAALNGTRGPYAWRNYSFSEFFSAADTWAALRFPLPQHRVKVHWWCTNQSEVFDIAQDAWELNNTAQSGGAGDLARELPTLVALTRCRGGLCRHPEPQPINDTSLPLLPCHSEQGGGGDFFDP